MPSRLKLIIHPYSSVEGDSLLENLITEFQSGRWSAFHAAIAFLKPSGNFDVLLEAMLLFLNDGGSLSMTLGADLFGEAQGSDYEALKALLTYFQAAERTSFFSLSRQRPNFSSKALSILQ